MTQRVLIIGYGNMLRTDDGLGRRAADLLAEDDRFRDAAILQLHQLGPELALDFSLADIVVVVDANTATPAGSVTVHHGERADPDAGPWSHHVDPSSLVALAHGLYGRCGDVFAVSVGVASLEVGEGLSPVVEAALPRVIEAVADLVATSGAEPGTEPGAGPRAVVIAGSGHA